LQFHEELTKIKSGTKQVANQIKSTMRQGAEVSMPRSQMKK